MKTNFLFPNRFRKIGWILFVPSVLIAFIVPLSGFTFDNVLTTKVFAVAEGGFLSDNVFFGFTENSIADEIVLVLLMIGGLLIGFSKLKTEDEYIAQIRYESLVWATYFNFAVMLLATLFVYGTFYLNVLIINLFALLLFFIIRFELKLSQLQKAAKDDE